MTKEEILHLGLLSRIELTDTEAETLKDDITNILSYVGKVQEIADQIPPKEVGVVHNVFREDISTDKPGQYTEAILAAAPQRHQNYIAVKKILSTDE